MKTLFPEIEPYRTGYLQVDAEHSLYFEECGNPNGQPVLFLHGGPGAGIESYHRRFFDPAHYRILLFDQRGAGKSKPHASLNNNTTWDLVSDIEKLRVHFDVKKWLVFGGSWGSTLSLAYSQTHPERCTGLILRGIFMCRKKELDWFYQSGAHAIFPDEFERYAAVIPKSEQHQMIESFYRQLTSEDLAVQVKAARAWARWEGATLRLVSTEKQITDWSPDAKAIALARIECHYFVNKAFFKSDTWLLDQLESIRNIPAVIVQGRYDVICPFESAWELHKSWPESKLEIIPDAGHAASEPGIVDALVRATERFKS